MTQSLRLGYLHLGPPRYGLSRYGRLLANEARRHGTEVVESTLELTGGWRHDRASLLAAARHLARADVVHVQYSHLAQRSVWGSGWRRLSNLSAFFRRSGPPVVVTIHDSYALSSRPSWRRSLPDEVALRWVVRAARAIFVSSQEERRRLLPSVPHDRILVIPHFVEERAISLDASAAKRELGLNGLKVVTLLGFVHNRKGHHLLLDALSYLPHDVFLVFAGEPLGDAAAVRQVHDRVARHHDRVRLTGYLPDEELNRYLAATDIAVCPFRHMSASGSVATWISARKPILASDLPQIGEYNDLAPGAIATFTPYTPAGLAGGISELLQRDPAASRSAVARLAEALSLPRMFDKHMTSYMAVLRRSDHPPRKSVVAATE